MPKRGLNASVMFNGYDLSTYFNKAAMNATVNLLDATTFQPSGGDKIYVPGFTDGSLSLEGFFESDASAPEVGDVLDTVLGSETKQVVTISPENVDTLGNRCYLLDADTVSYEVSSPVAGLVQCNAQLQSSGGVGYGRILQVKGALTATGNGTSYDSGASSTGGGVGHIHATTVSGTTPTLTGKIQHSSDNSSWSDLISFTQLTDEGAERIEVSGTVNRYLRFIRTIGGTGPSFTVTVAFARF